MRLGTYFCGVIFLEMNLPPSPPAIPVIGHLHLFKAALPPYQTLFELSKRYGDFMWLKFGSRPTLVVSSADAAKDILKTNDRHFASRPQNAMSEAFSYSGADMAFAPYGQYWKSLRKVCAMELFTPQRIEYFKPARSQQMRIFLDDLSKASSEKRVLNMSEVVHDFTFSVILKMILGFQDSSVTKDVSSPACKFRALFMEASKLASQFHIGECFPWLEWLDFSLPHMKRMGNRMDDFLQQQLDEHRASFDPDHLRDFLDVLISVSKNSGFSDTTIKAVTHNMLLGGLDTSAVSVEWTLAEIVRNPEVMNKIQKELNATIPPGEQIVHENYLPSLHYLQAVIRENLRLHPPLPMLVPHLSVTDCKLAAGYQIPKNTQTLVNAYAIGRDGSVWEDPLKFNPERMENVDMGTSFEFVPFGNGRRICPGMNLGLTTVQFMLANLLYKFNWKTVEPVDVCEASAFTLMRENPLKLIPIAK